MKVLVYRALQTPAENSTKAGDHAYQPRRAQHGVQTHLLGEREGI